MTAGDFYRIEFRIQNSTRKYYLVREIFSDAKKFSASRLITSGTPPTRTETDRCASLYGFDLELKCITKAAKYRTALFRFDQTDDADAVFEMERFRLFSARKAQMNPADRVFSHIASCRDVTFTEDELTRLFSNGTIPQGKTLSAVNRVQNLRNAWQMRDGKMLTAAKLYKLHAVLSANLGVPKLEENLRPALEKLLRGFSGNIKAGFYPFEQCILFYQDLQNLIPDEELFTEEILSILLDSFGYPIPPAQAKTLDLAFSFAAAENPKLESEIRQLNAGLFKVKSGGKQKQLDLF